MRHFFSIQKYLWQNNLSGSNYNQGNPNQSQKDVSPHDIGGAAGNIEKDGEALDFQDDDAQKTMKRKIIAFVLKTGTVTTALSWIWIEP